MNIKRIGLDLGKMSSRYMPWITVSMLSFVKPCAVTAWRPFHPTLTVRFIGIEACGSAHYWARS